MGGAPPPPLGFAPQGSKKGVFCPFLGLRYGAPEGGFSPPETPRIKPRQGGWGGVQTHYPPWKRPAEWRPCKGRSEQGRYPPAKATAKDGFTIIERGVQSLERAIWMIELYRCGLPSTLCRAMAVFQIQFQ